MSQKLTPLGTNVLVRPIPEETTTASGIVISTKSEEKPGRGQIISIGPGDADQAPPKNVNPGDTVYFTKYAPTEIKVDGEELYLIEFKSLLAIEK